MRRNSSGKSAPSPVVDRAVPSPHNTALVELRDERKVMSRCTTIGLCGTAMLVASVAAAPADQDRPLLLPTRDVAVTYALDHQGPGAAKQAHVYYSASTNRLRLENPGEKQVIIFDRAAKMTTMVMLRQHVYFQMPIDPEIELGFMLTPDMKFERAGSETIAGHRCTDWTVQSSRVTGTACITDDGVLLLGRGREGTAGGGVEAVAVSYAPQPASLFAPPPDFRKIEMSIAPEKPGK
jgi:hypothetical protein